MKMRSTEEFGCDEAIKSIFDLNNLDLEVYKKLRETGVTRTITLAKKLNRERSTVYRSLQKLTSCGICTKQTKTLDKGGYYYVYKINEIEKVRKKAESCLDNWYKSMKKKLMQLEG